MGNMKRKMNHTAMAGKRWVLLFLTGATMALLFVRAGGGWTCSYYFYNNNTEALTNLLHVANKPQSTDSAPSDYEHTKSQNDQDFSSKRTRRRAYVIGVYGGTKYLCGAAMVAWTLRQRQPDIDLVAFVAGRLSGSKRQHQTALDYLHRLGYKTYNAPLLYNSFGVSSALLQRNSIMFSKLNMYRLTDYDQGIYLDTDYFLPAGSSELDRLFDRYSHYKNKPVAFREGETKYMNGGMILYQPNASVYFEMLEKMNTIESFDGGDQGFQSTYFQQYQQGYDFFPAPEWRSVVNVRKKSIKNQHYVWAEPVPTDNPKRPIHMFSVKVWQCPREQYCAETEKRGLRMIWPQLFDTWWQYFDEMTREWKFLLEDDTYRGYCIANAPPASAAYVLNRTDVWGRIQRYQQQREARRKKKAI